VIGGAMQARQLDTVNHTKKMKGKKARNITPLWSKVNYRPIQQ
jgi:hypothetical protein